jgi:SAM-dependent methyltransferase
MATPAIEAAVRGYASALEPGAEVLDVGCGLRPYEEFFAHCTYVGLDVEESGRTADEKNADIYFNGLDIPGEDNRYDGTICNEVLEHCVDPVKLLSEMHRVLKPGGKLMVTVPFIWGIHEAPYDFRRYSHYGLVRELESVGFVVVEQERLTPGFDAIELLVASEINNFEVNVHHEPDAASERRRRRRKVEKAERLWKSQLEIWRELYDFERIHIDNLVIGVKQDGQAP